MAAPETYRLRALKAEVLANRARDPAIRDGFLRVAETWRDLAAETSDPTEALLWIARPAHARRDRLR